MQSPWKTDLSFRTGQPLVCVPIISGRPPILVLSYKNHAIDEFLKDLIKAEGPSISLIRIGGVSKDPTLATFAEQNHKKDVKISNF